MVNLIKKIAELYIIEKLKLSIDFLRIYESVVWKYILGNIKVDGN